MTVPGIGDLELAALLVVARQADEAYGASIRRDLSERAGRAYSVGAVYATLQRLEDKGFVRSFMSDPTPVRGGRSRRCYRLTASGARKLTHERTASTALWKGIRIQPRTA